MGSLGDAGLDEDEQGEKGKRQPAPASRIAPGITSQVLERQQKIISVPTPKFGRQKLQQERSEDPDPPGLLHEPAAWADVCKPGP